MQTAQGNMLESLQSVKTFLDQHPDQFAAVINTGTRSELLKAIVALEQYGDQQSAGFGASKNATKIAQSRRRALRRRMRIVSRIGQSKLPEAPELANLKMPRGRPSNARLVAAAFEMANSADSNAPVFVTAGLGEDFVTRLKGAANAMTDASHERAMSRASHVIATKGLRERLAAGRRIVGVLDAMIQDEFTNDPVLLAGWNRVKRVPRVSGPASGASAPAAPAPAPAPAVAAPAGHHRPG